MPTPRPCAVCGVATELQCAACLTPRYCGGACQKKDWSAHRPRCRELREGVSSALWTSRRGKEVCAVCSARVADESTGTRLICGCLFHSACARSWFARRGTCPSCETLHRYVKVVYRGFGFDVEVTGDVMDIGHACLNMLDQFREKYMYFHFRLTPSTDPASYVITWKRGKTPLNPRATIALLENVAAAARESRGETGPAVVSVAVDIPAHDMAIPNDEFQWARIELKKPENVTDWEHAVNAPPGCHDFYRRPPGWVAHAQEEHLNGRCSWTRLKRLRELEAELVHDYLVDFDDEAWEARRPLYVELHQALAACRSDDGVTRWTPEQLPKQFPVDTTFIHPPPGRDYDEHHIIDEAAWSAPVYLYGCPFILETIAVSNYLHNAMLQAGIDAAKKHDQTEPIYGNPDLVRHVSIEMKAGSYKQAMASVNPACLWEDEKLDESFKNLAAAVVVIIRFEEEGNGENVSHVICWNKHHAEFCKLPEMSAEEAQVLMPFDLPLAALLRSSENASKKKALAKQKKERRARRKARSR